MTPIYVLVVLWLAAPGKVDPDLEVRQIQWFTSKQTCEDAAVLMESESNRRAVCLEGYLDLKQK